MFEKLAFGGWFGNAPLIRTGSQWRSSSKTDPDRLLQHKLFKHDIVNLELMTTCISISKIAMQRNRNIQNFVYFLFP